MADDPLNNLKPGLEFDDPPPKPEGATPTGRKPRSDKGRPRGPRGSRKKEEGATDAELVKALEEMLVFPALPSMFFYPTMEGKLYLTQHFTTTAPWGAKRLVEASKLSPPLRRILEKAREQTAMSILITFGVVYLGGPVLFALGAGDRAQALTMMASMDESVITNMAEASMGAMMEKMQAMVSDQGMNGGQEQTQSQPNEEGETFPSGDGETESFPNS